MFFQKMDSRNITIIILLIAVLALAVGSGVLLQKDLSQFGKAAKTEAKMEAVVKSLSSQAVPSVVAFGEVSKIDGRNITLTYNGDSVTVAIKEDAQISSFVVPSGGGAGKQTIVPFGNIKNNDKLSINLKVLSDGQLQGQSVIILNSSN